MKAGEGRGGTVRRWALRVALALGVLGVGTWAAFQLSPWPSVLLIRWVFDRGAAEASEALRKHPAAFPELVVTSSRSASGMPELRAAMIKVVAERGS